MLKNIKNIAKKLLVSNLSLIAVTLPSLGEGTPNLPQTSLLIPQERLDSSFKVDESKAKEPTIQIPLTYIYMSQNFSTYHPAIDLAAEAKTPVKAILPGTVIEAGYSTYGYGNCIVIQHKNGLESRYAHLSKISVKFGQKVDENTIIGTVGSTGHSTGIHLHLEINQNGKLINPLSVLPGIYKQGLITSK